jgi:purine-binding chemotaxis protein CheW
MDSERETSDRKQFLGFTVGGVDYGISILKVKEILQYEAITRVPSTPASIRGVINLRGSVVPIVDLAVKFGLPETSPTKWTCILVLESSLDGEALVIGVLADVVSEVIDLGPGDVEPAPPFGTRVRLEYLLGMGKVGKKFVLLLDIDRVLSAAEHEVATSISSDPALTEAATADAADPNAAAAGGPPPGAPPSSAPA